MAAWTSTIQCFCFHSCEGIRNEFYASLLLYQANDVLILYYEDSFDLTDPWKDLRDSQGSVDLTLRTGGFEGRAVVLRAETWHFEYPSFESPELCLRRRSSLRGAALGRFDNRVMLPSVSSFPWVGFQGLSPSWSFPTEPLNVVPAEPNTPCTAWSWAVIHPDTKFHLCVMIQALEPP